MGGDTIPGPLDVLREAFEKDPGAFMRILLARRVRRR